MDLTRILDEVDVERMYQHVLRLEGPKHPLDTPDKLKQAADYIYSELARYGVPVRVQEFQIDGSDDTFRNVEGWVGDESAPAVVIINHHDNVYNDPGANDNAAGVAVMLEAARVLAGHGDVPTIRFVSATLEEGNPVLQGKARQSARSLGLTDDQHRYKTHRVARVMQEYTALVQSAREAGKSYRDAASEALEQLRDQTPEPVRKHVKNLQTIFGDGSRASNIGKMGLIGSSVWLDEAVRTNKKLKFAICHDEIGTTSKQEHSQRWPPGADLDMMQTFKVDLERRVADFAFLITDAASAKIARAFGAHCQRESINLPYAWLPLPLGFEQIVQEFPIALGSDHAPFWRAGIPTLFINDTSWLRNPYVHTQADTIDKLDFEHITRICKATIATAIDQSIEIE